MQDDLDGLLPYATEAQSRYIEAVQAHGTKEKAADVLDVNIRTVYRAIAAVKRKASKQGFSPDHDMVHTAPDGYSVKGVSTLYDQDGAIKAQWVKTNADHQAHNEELIQMLEDACERLPQIPEIALPSHSDDCLCTVYTITDFHLGMLAWEKETGDAWDLKIAERTLVNAFNDLMASTPNSSVAVFNQLGDFLHFDGLDAVTPSSGHVLDADSRYAKVVQLALDVTVKVVGMLLKKHMRVHVLMCEGNHDLSGSIWLRVALRKLFADNPRVHVDDTALPFYIHEHGDVLLGFHHGHKVKNRSLPSLFASEPRFRQAWGNAKYTYIHTGHYHHSEQEISEGGGAIVERHPTLAARDAYSARGGYVSWRSAKAITYDIEMGEVSRASVVPRSD